MQFEEITSELLNLNRLSTEIYQSQMMTLSHKSTDSTLDASDDDDVEV